MQLDFVTYNSVMNICETLGAESWRGQRKYFKGCLFHLYKDMCTNRGKREVF